MLVRPMWIGSGLNNKIAAIAYYNTIKIAIWKEDHS